MIEFGFVPLHTVVNQIKPNVARHHAEMNESDDYGPPDVDWESYLEASHNGCCMVVTAMHFGKLIGYIIFDIGYNPRYKTRLEASSSGIFIEKEYRGRISMQLLEKADEFLKQVGVQECGIIINDEKFGKLLSRKGYAAKYIVWSKEYGK